MSYRNPGQIYISNPNAFMEAFEKGIAPIKADLEKKAAERKERAKKYDASNAKLKESLNYPEWVKKYGKQKADTIKTMIEEDFIANNRFASATQSEQQDMLDNINITVSGIAQKTDAALQLDYDEILPGHFSDNKEFLDFLASKPEEGNDVSLERVNGKVGFSYIKDGQKVFLDADNIPDGAINYQGKTATDEAINKAILAAKDEVDDKFTTAKTLTEAAGYTKTKAASIYSAMDDSQKEYLFEKMQIDLNGDEEGTGNYTYADVKDNPELKKILDQGLVEYITGEIENESRQLTRLRSEEEVRVQKEKEELAKAAATTTKVSTKEEVSNFIVQFNTMVNKGSQNAFIDFAQRTIPGIMKMPNGNYTIPSADPEEKSDVLTEDQLIATLADFYTKNPAAFANAKNSVMNIDTTSGEMTTETATEEGDSTNTDWNQFKVN